MQQRIGLMKKLFFFLILVFSSITCRAHPMPNSVIALDINPSSIRCELQLPLKELQYAVPFDVTNNTTELFSRHEMELSDYIRSHFSIYKNLLL